LSQAILPENRETGQSSAQEAYREGSGHRPRTEEAAAPPPGAADEGEDIEGAATLPNGTVDDGGKEDGPREKGENGGRGWPALQRQETRQDCLVLDLEVALGLRSSLPSTRFRSCATPVPPRRPPLYPLMLSAGFRRFGRLPLFARRSRGRETNLSMLLLDRNKARLLAGKLAMINKYDRLHTLLHTLLYCGASALRVITPNYK
jgi:hypothetical protein